MDSQLLCYASNPQLSSLVQPSLCFWQWALVHVVVVPSSMEPAAVRCDNFLEAQLSPLLLGRWINGPQVNEYALFLARLRMHGNLVSGWNNDNVVNLR